ncbi:hypothetical protein PXK60_06565 [Phaeobacter gallaeciensis]|nr:hypothetical protein [Phaeobacter gallaeciensis]
MLFELKPKDRRFDFQQRGKIICGFGSPDVSVATNPHLDAFRYRLCSYILALRANMAAPIQCDFSANLPSTSAMIVPEGLL